MNNTSNEGPKLSWLKKIKDTNETIAIIGVFIASILVLLNKVEKLTDYRDWFLIGIDTLNILALVFAYYKIKPVELEVSAIEIPRLKEKLNIKENTEVEFNRTRVNELVKQLVQHIHWFVGILLFFYLIQVCIDAKFILNEEAIKSTLSHKTSTDLFHLLSGPCENKADAAAYLGLELLTNTTNIFSAAFLLLAFQVLFVITIDQNDNRKWRFHYFPIYFSILLFFLNVVVLFSGISGETLSNISHLMRLVGGMFNGVAMLLLFSRFISMEYFFQNSTIKWQKHFYFYGTIVVLPLYVLAQPMYGLFNAIEMGANAVVFKSIIFLVCFCGKIVFLLFIYTIIKKKWMHSYLFIALTQKDTVSEISRDLQDVDDMS